MNCREFKEQFEDGRNLSKEANIHLGECSNCEAFHGENLRLTQMISSLPSVEAPKNFEFGFKSKLAETQLNKPLSPIWRALRYILPVSAAVLIFGFVIINSNLFTQTENPQIAKDKDAIKMELAPEKENSFAENQPPVPELVAEKIPKTDEAKIPEKDEKIVDTQDNKKKSNTVAENKAQKEKIKDSDDEEIITLDIIPETDEPTILNKDSALSIPEINNPEGLNPDKKINKTQINPNAKTFTAKEILSQLGIETSTVGGRLTVNLVRRNSVGLKSGVKVGDVITAINGQGISKTSQRSRRVQGSSLTVKRKGKTLNIAIRSN